MMARSSASMAISSAFLVPACIMPLGRPSDRVQRPLPRRGARSTVPSMAIDGTLDIERAASDLAARLPEALRPLARVAYNYSWSWTEDGRALLHDLDPHRWELTSGNMVSFLEQLTPSALARIAASPELIARIDALAAEVDRAVASTPGSDRAGSDRLVSGRVAFLCAEFAIHASLPIYSGGLGVLAGDMLKEASDRGLPYVGVGLLYRRGYFHQRLDLRGWQRESWDGDGPRSQPAGARHLRRVGARCSCTCPCSDATSSARSGGSTSAACPCSCSTPNGRRTGRSTGGSPAASTTATGPSAWPSTPCSASGASGPCRRSASSTTSSTSTRATPRSPRSSWPPIGSRPGPPSTTRRRRSAPSSSSPPTPPSRPATRPTAPTSSSPPSATCPAASASTSTASSGCAASTPTTRSRRPA